MSTLKYFVPKNAVELINEIIEKAEQALEIYRDESQFEQGLLWVSQAPGVSRQVTFLNCLHLFFFKWFRVNNAKYSLEISRRGHRSVFTFVPNNNAEAIESVEFTTIEDLPYVINCLSHVNPPFHNIDQERFMQNYITDLIHIQQEIEPQIEFNETAEQSPSDIQISLENITKEVKPIIIINTSKNQVVLDGDEINCSENIIKATKYFLKMQKAGFIPIDRIKLLKEIGISDSKKPISDIFKSQPNLDDLIKKHQDKNGHPVKNKFYLDVDIKSSKIID